jgi:hypothetical protein
VPDNLWEIAHNLADRRCSARRAEPGQLLGPGRPGRSDPADLDADARPAHDDVLVRRAPEEAVRAEVEAAAGGRRLRRPRHRALPAHPRGHARPHRLGHDDRRPRRTSSSSRTCRARPRPPRGASPWSRSRRRIDSSRSAPASSSGGRGSSTATRAATATRARARCSRSSPSRGPSCSRRRATRSCVRPVAPRPSRRPSRSPWPGSRSCAPRRTRGAAYTVQGAGTLALMTVTAAGVHVEGLRFAHTGTTASAQGILTTNAADRLTVSAASSTTRRSCDVDGGRRRGRERLRRRARRMDCTLPRPAVRREVHDGDRDHVLPAPDQRLALLRRPVRGLRDRLRAHGHRARCRRLTVTRVRVPRVDRRRRRGRDGAWDGSDGTNATVGPIKLEAAVDQYLIDRCSAYTALAAGRGFLDLNAIASGALGSLVQSGDEKDVGTSASSRRRSRARRSRRPAST